MIRTVRMMVTVSVSMPVVVLRFVRVMVTVSMSMPVSHSVVVIRPVAQPMTELGFVTIPWSVAVIRSMVAVDRTAVSGTMAVPSIRHMAVRLGILDFVTVCVRNTPPPFGIALVTHSATA
ncbi:hypothetical protein ACWEO2_25140 [Nocardia sp. NPDC004278]